MNHKLHTRTCFILRGMPGSGKTTLALTLVASLQPTLVTHISLDLIRARKGYVNNRELALANMDADVSQMKNDFKDAVQNGISYVILDNVHLRWLEYEWAWVLATESGYIVHILELQAPLLTCWGRRQHQITWEEFVEMANTWETYPLEKFVEMAKQWDSV